MKLIVYILRKLVPFFAVSLFFVALILNLVDLFMNISKYLEQNVSARTVLTIMLYYAPKTVWYAAPIAFLFSVTYVLSDLYANNEMEALFASGVSLFRFILPVLVLGLFLSVALFVLEDRLVVTYLERKNSLQASVLGQKQSSNNENVVVISDNARIVYKASRYRESLKRLDNVYFIFRNPDMTLDSIIHAANAIWDEDNGRWSLANSIQYEVSGDTVVSVPVSDGYVSRLTESYEIFRRTNANIDNMNVYDARLYIEHLRKAGLPYGEELSVYYKKFAFPFILFIAAFLAVGVTGKTRKNVLLISLSLSIAAVVLFYVFQMVTMVLAKTGVFPPLMGAWLPDLVFTLLAGVLLRYSRT